VGSSTKISLLTELGVLEADEHEVVEHAFGRQRDVHDLGKIHLEDGQEQFHARAADVKILHRRNADTRRRIHRVLAMCDGDCEKFGLEFLPPLGRGYWRFELNRASKSFGATNTSDRPALRCSSNFNLARLNRSVLAV
jgi:hypothetical protein